jgi:hypothetical protein
MITLARAISLCYLNYHRYIVNAITLIYIVASIQSARVIHLRLSTLIVFPAMAIITGVTLL